MGLERLMLLLGDGIGLSNTPNAVVVSQGKTAEALAVPVARRLRKMNQAVELDLSGSGFGKQLKRAGKSGARWAVLIGEEEAERGVLQLKDLQNGESQAIHLASLEQDWPTS